MQLVISVSQWSTRKPPQKVLPRWRMWIVFSLQAHLPTDIFFSSQYLPYFKGWKLGKYSFIPNPTPRQLEFTFCFAKACAFSFRNNITLSWLEFRYEIYTFEKPKRTDSDMNCILITVTCIRSQRTEGKEKGNLQFTPYKQQKKKPINEELREMNHLCLKTVLSKYSWRQARSCLELCLSQTQSLPQ